MRTNLARLDDFPITSDAADGRMCSLGTNGTGVGVITLRSTGRSTGVGGCSEAHS